MRPTGQFKSDLPSSPLFAFEMTFSRSTGKRPLVLLWEAFYAFSPTRAFPPWTSHWIVGALFHLCAHEKALYAWASFVLASFAQASASEQGWIRPICSLCCPSPFGFGRIIWKQAIPADCEFFCS